MPKPPESPQTIFVPSQLLNSPATAYSLATYAALAALGALAPGGSELCLSEIAGAARISPRTARRELRWLTQAGWLQIEHTPGSASLYRLAPKL